MNYRKFATTILSVISIVGLLALGALFGGYLPKPEQEKQNDKLSAAITTIAATDLIKDSRATINTNFSNLNTDKLEASNLTGFGGFGNLTAQTLTATSTTATSTISWGLAAIQRIGIGSTATTTIFGNNGTSVFNSLLDIRTSGTSTFTGGITASNLQATSLTSSGALSLFATGSNSLLFQTNGSERMRIDSSGNVGVGTTSPSSLLSVSGSSGFGLVNTGTGNTFYAYDEANDTTPFVIDSSGNVGIGTTSPTEKVEILSDTLHDIGFGTVTAGKAGVLGWLNTAAAPVPGLFSTSASFRLALGANRTEHVTISTTGNVGIGTTSPGLLLSVAGNGLFGGSTGTTTIEHGLNLATKGGGITIATTSPSTSYKLLIDGAATIVQKRIASAASPTFNWADSNYQIMALSQAGHSISFTGGLPGANLKLELCQDSTGNRTVTSWGTNILFMTSDLTNSTSTPGLTTKANTCNLFSFTVSTATGTQIYRGVLPLKDK